MPHQHRAALWLKVALLLIGAGLRFHHLASPETLHPDEALFASLGRRMVLQNDFMLGEATTDKPPTTYLLVGTSLALVGENSFSARLPSAFASLIGVAAFFALARHCTQNSKITYLAFLIYTLSPLDIAFASTVFQDTPMLACILLATWFASIQRWGWSGGMFGLALAMKPTGLWVLPLVLAIGVFKILGQSEIDPYGMYQRRIGRGRAKTYPLLLASFKWLVGLLIALAPIISWDLARPQQSFVTLGSYNNNPGRLIRADEVWARGEVWLNLWADMMGGVVAAIIFFSIGMIWLFVSAKKRYPTGLMSWFIILYLVWYVGIYWLVAFSPRIRYLIPVVPFLLLIIAQGIGWLANRWKFGEWVSAGIIILLMGGSAINATSLSQEEQGFDLAGIDELADTLNRDFAGAIVYDNWLGWELGWYLGRDTDIWVVYFSTPEELAAHLQTEEGTRYFVAPNENLGYMWVALLNLKGVETTPIRQIEDFVIYQVVPPKSVKSLLE